MKKRPQIFELIVSADNTAALARGLTEKKAEINAAVDLRGMSLLRAACELHMDSRKGRWDVIRVLLEHGANPNIRWMDPVRVEYAKSMSDRHIPYSGEILVDYVVSRAVTTPNALELLKLLVEVGKADVNAVRHDGKSVLRTACSGCCWEVAQWLLWEVAVADAESFAIACAHGQWALARLFVDKGVDVQARCASAGMQGLTPLHCACLGRRRGPATSSSPSSAGDEEDEEEGDAAGGQDGGPGGAEQMLGQVDVVKALLDVGADPNAADTTGRTPLHLLASQAVSAAVAADPVESPGDADNGDGAGGGDVVGKCRFLLIGLAVNAGADVNARDDEGRTPLHGFAAAGDAASVTQLLAAGADKTVADNEGRSPCDVAALGAYKALGLQTAGETLLEALLLPMSVAVSPFRFGINCVLKGSAEAAAEEESNLKLIISPLRQAAGVGPAATPVRAPLGARPSSARPMTPAAAAAAAPLSEPTPAARRPSPDGLSSITSAHARSNISFSTLEVPSEFLGDHPASAASAMAAASSDTLATDPRYPQRPQQHTRFPSTATTSTAAAVIGVDELSPLHTPLRQASPSPSPAPLPNAASSSPLRAPGAGAGARGRAIAEPSSVEGADASAVTAAKPGPLPALGAISEASEKDSDFGAVVVVSTPPLEPPPPPTDRPAAAPRKDPATTAAPKTNDDTAAKNKTSRK